MCFIKFEVYLNMLSGKIITANPALSRLIISRAPSEISPELSPARNPSVSYKSKARVSASLKSTSILSRYDSKRMLPGRWEEGG